MKRTSIPFFLSVMVITMLSQFIVSEAQARRFGGGASFGSRPSFSKSFKRAPLKRSLSPTQKQAAAKNQVLRNNMRQRGGIMGMLGALAMGGLLGSLLFGGAFENFNLFDMLMIGAIVYLAFKLMSRNRPMATAQPYARSSYEETELDDTTTPLSQNDSKPFNTDLLFKEGPSSHHLDRQSDDTQAADERTMIEIDDFDQTVFLNGAKTAFQMLQQAWDNKDLSEIRPMTTDKVFAEIKQQIQQNNITNHTEILSLNADILSARENGSQLEVQVLFDANIHELPESITSNIQEVWHFVRPANTRHTMWFVDGIQQVD